MPTGWDRAVAWFWTGRNMWKAAALFWVVGIAVLVGGGMAWWGLRATDAAVVSVAYVAGTGVAVWGLWSLQALRIGGGDDRGV
jgi:hypothetical protein